MSPTPRSAKYPVSHGCHHLRGGGNVRLWSSSPPWRRWSVVYSSWNSGASGARVCASIIACNLAIGSERPATASGVAILGAYSRSGHVADAQVGEIPGYARLPPPPGWRITSPLVIVSAVGGDGALCIAAGTAGRVCASIIACNLAIGSGRPATASGVAILGACSRSGHVADAQVGEIPGFARLPPPPGWRITSPLVIVSALAEMGSVLREQRAVVALCERRGRHGRRVLGGARGFP